MSDAAALMDRMYRRQRHIYDLSRKFYLLGRDEAIAGLRARAGRQGARDRLRHRAQSRQAGAAPILRRGSSASTCRGKCWRARRLRWRAPGFPPASPSPEADATAFDPEALFGEAAFERVMISYALSMIPPWREALAQALDVLAPGGSLASRRFRRLRRVARPVQDRIAPLARRLRRDARATISAPRSKRSRPSAA